MAPLTDDIQWRVQRPSPVAGTYTGKQEVLDFFPRMMAPYEGTLQVQVTAIVADDRHGFVAVKKSAQRPVKVWPGPLFTCGASGMVRALASRAITTTPTPNDRRLRELISRLEAIDRPIAIYAAADAPAP